MEMMGQGVSVEMMKAGEVIKQMKADEADEADESK